MLNHAAALLVSRARRAGVVVTLTLLLGLAGPAVALDGIDLDEPVAPPAEGECPLLVQIKYPFLSCADGQIGQSDRNETWENTRHIQIMRDWTEGTGYWGPELNPVSN